MLFRAYQCSQLTLAGPFALGHGREMIGFGREHLDIGHLWRLASPVLALAANPQAALIGLHQPPGNLSDTHSG